MQHYAEQMQLHAEQVQLRSDQMHHHAVHLETSLEATRGRITELETSRAWRMTAPLRNAGHQAKVARARLHAWRAGIRRLPQLTVTALSVLRHEGPGALAQRLRAKVVPEERFKPSAEVHFEVEESPTPLAFAPAAEPVASIVIPVYGKPMLTFTCLKSIHENTAHDLCEIIVVDDASPQPAAEALAVVSGVRFERNQPEPGLHRHLQSRRGNRARQVPRVPQQRHDRHARLARGAAARVRHASRRRARRREARLPGRAPAGSGRHRLARRLGVELRARRRSRPPRVQLPARGRLLLGCLPRGAGGALPRTPGLRQTLCAGVLRGCRSRLRRACGGTQGVLPARLDGRAFRGTDLRHGHRRRA